MVARIVDTELLFKWFFAAEINFDAPLGESERMAQAHMHAFADIVDEHRAHLGQQPVVSVCTGSSSMGVAPTAGAGCK